MKKRSTHSHLQNKILLYMGSHSVNSLTKLAQELNVHRSSVSRAIHSLSATGLVLKDGTRWGLTPEGKEELKRFQLQLPIQVTKTAASTNRLIEQGRLAALSSRVSALDVMKPFTEASKVTKAALRMMEEEARQVRLMTETAREAIQPFASSLDIAKSFTAISVALKEAGFTRAEREALQYARLADIALGRPAQESQRVFDEIAAQMRSEILAFNDAINSAKLTRFDLMEAFSAKPTFAEIAARQMQDTFADKSTRFMAEINSQLAKEALVSFSESQRLSSFSIEQAAGLGKIDISAMKELTQANLGIGEMIRDLGMISTRNLAEQVGMRNIAADMMPNVAEIARTYRGYLADTFSNLNNDLNDRINWRIGIPTGTTSAYISTVKVAAITDTLDAEDADLLEATRNPWEGGAIQLDNVFRELGPNYIAMWQGCWAVLRSDSPHRFSQAAHSGRELLIQFLAKRAPDTAFDVKEIKLYGYEGKITRKMRVRKILENGNDSAINLVDALTRALEETYGRLVAICHDRGEYPQFTEQQIAGLLYALGGLLAFIEGFRR
jgi:DNA-binding MarR family transcriptional regulator